MQAKQSKVIFQDGLAALLLMMQATADHGKRQHVTASNYCMSNDAGESML